MSKVHPVVITDSREQLPYSFPQEWPVLTKALPSGDYSLLGLEHQFAIERKSLSDLLGCIFTDRFKRELERLAEFEQAYLVIEASLWKIRNHANRFAKKINPEAVIGMLQSISVRYGVHVSFLDDRETAQRYTQGLIEKYHRHLLSREPKDSAEEIAE